MERVMITMPERLLDSVDRMARQMSENRSQFVREALTERLANLRQRELEARMAEGYRVMADEMMAMAEDAEVAQATASEVWRWDE